MPEPFFPELVRKQCFDVCSPECEPDFEAAAAEAADAPASVGAETVNATARTAAPSTDAWAYGIARSAAPSMPENQRQYVLTVARGEGYYGKGWKGAGAGSNNWGAVQGTGSAGSFQHGDTHADGSKYTTHFKAYRTPEEGFLDMAKYVLKPNVVAALNRGHLRDAVYAQHDNHYFELAPEKYFAAVSANYAKITSAVGWPKLLADYGVTPARAGLGIGTLLAGLGVGYFIARRLG
jgi:hypothetical protein